VEQKSQIKHDNIGFATEMLPVRPDSVKLPSAKKFKATTTEEKKLYGLTPEKISGAVYVESSGQRASFEVAKTNDSINEDS